MSAPLPSTAPAPAPAPSLTAPLTVPPPPPSNAWKTAKPFVNGGLSGMAATCIIQPIDMVKVRIQLGAKGNPFAVASAIIKSDGFGGLYKGLSAGLLRQATYTTTRMGVFGTISDKLKEINGGKNLSLAQKAGAGLTAGAIGALVGNPADLSLIRMQADATLPEAQKRHYKGVGDALIRTVRAEGVSGLFRGASPTVVRAMALNMGMLATNDEAREWLESVGAEKGGAVAVLGSASLAGLVASSFSLPFDFVKTRMQKMTPNPDGTLPYKSTLDCFSKTFTQEGILKFYTGFPTYCVRIAPHVVFTLVFADQLPKLQKSVGW